MGFILKGALLLGSFLVILKLAYTNGPVRKESGGGVLKGLRKTVKAGEFCTQRAGAEGPARAKEDPLGTIDFREDVEAECGKVLVYEADSGDRVFEALITEKETPMGRNELDWQNQYISRKLFTISKAGESHVLLKDIRPAEKRLRNPICLYDRNGTKSLMGRSLLLESGSTTYIGIGDARFILDTFPAGGRTVGAGRRTSWDATMRSEEYAT